MASGTDQAHISRIERGERHPEYSTLVRICDVLELSPAERTYVRALAGYEAADPLPDSRAVDSILAVLAPLIDSYSYPVTLLDIGERLWYLNAPWARFWGQCYGTTNPKECLARMRGRRNTELLFDPDRWAESFPRWKALCQDVERALMRNVAMFWRPCRIWPQDPELNRILARLKRNPEFLSRWLRVEHGEYDFLFLDHATYPLMDPQLGRLQFHVWRTRSAADERFIVAHHTPADEATSRALSRLAESFSHCRSENRVHPAAKGCQRDPASSSHQP